jgi:hypothetical protein
MRFLLLFLAAAPAYGETRTWTIATDVYTAEAEFVAMRGDTVYLRTGDQVKPVPFARLSAADQRFITSMTLAPVLPGPTPRVEASQYLMPEQDARPIETADALPVPALGGEGEFVLPSPPGAVEFDDRKVQLLPTPARTMTDSNRRAPQASRDGSSARRQRADQQQSPPRNRSATNDNRSQDDDRRGILGGRRRRGE